MKKKPNKFLEKCRIKEGILKSDKSFGNNGAFEIPYKKSIVLNVIASDQIGWDHVSVSLPNMTPTWLMMCFVKDLFWYDNEVVIQYHPKKDDYINHHNYCLHLWKPKETELPTPPTWMIGLKNGP